MKIRPMETSFFYVDRQKYRKTDRQRYMIKLMVGFRNFANAPKNFHTKQTKTKTRVTDALSHGGSRQLFTLR